jgi:putative transcriptional regulator
MSMKSLQGHLLVASPKLGDPNFFRTAVLLVRHNEQGAFGVVLNRPSNTALRETWENVSDAPCNTDSVIYHGGPCPGPLMALHTDPSLAESDVISQLFFTTDKSELEALAANEDGKVRFFAGYAGWSASQLEAELDEGAWFTMPANIEHAFWPDDTLWDRLSNELASTTRIAGIRIKHTPPDPRWN